MKQLHAIAASAVALAYLDLNGAALATTSAYVTSGTMATPVQSCLLKMKAIAGQVGFTKGQEVLLDPNGMAGDFHGDSADLKMHFTARCNAVTKTWGIAVSGGDGNQTFQQYQRLYPLLP